MGVFDAAALNTISVMSAKHTIVSQSQNKQLRIEHGLFFTIYKSLDNRKSRASISFHAIKACDCKSRCLMQYLPLLPSLVFFLSLSLLLFAAPLRDSRERDLRRDETSRSLLSPVPGRRK